MRKMTHLLVGMLLSILALSTSVQAQETTSDIVGTVSDAGNPVAGATVTAIHTPTGTKYVTSTRKDGRFNLAHVRIGGPYVITIQYVGFNEEKIENIFLSLGQEYKADISLTTSTNQLSDVVIKSIKQDKIFNNSRTGGQEIVNRAQIERLPTISRSLQDFTKLEPTSNGLSFGGRSNQYNNLTVDGANFNNSFGLSGTLGGQTNSQPISLDALEQIQVNIAPYDVTQGGFSGAGINSVTRSGSNQVKASVYTYLKGPGTQGYKVGTTTVPKTDFSFHIDGFTIGAPIIKNKVFIFVNAEQVRQTAPATSIIASDAKNAPGGNVSNANADTLNALSTFLQQKFNYNPGEFQRYSFTTKSDKITAKIDWNINNSNTFSIKYNYLKSSADQFASGSRPGSSNSIPGVTGGQITGGQPGTNSMPFFGSGYVINNNFNIFIAELNTRFGNSASNKVQVGYTALRDFRSPHSDKAFPLVDILDGKGNIYTTFGYEPFTYNNILNTDVYQFADIYTAYKGSHEITLGTQDYYRKYANAFAPGYQGSYQFNTLQDFYNSVNNGTANARNYYLQYSALKDGSFPFAYAGSTELGFFAQDKWRVNKKFTLTYGLRVDWTIYKQSFTDNPSFDALTFKDGAQYNIGKAPKTTPLISPRIGFNWDVLGDKTLQVRGGAGIFSGPPPFVWISNQASNNGTQFGSLYNANIPFNADVNALRPQAGAANTSYAVALTSRDFKYPQVLKSSLAADKKLPGDVILTLEGTFSKDINAVYYQNINLNQQGGTAIANGGDQRIRYAVNNKYYSGTTLANPNIQNAILMSNTSKGYAYNATIRAQKNFRNLNLSVAYTYSQAKNTAEGGSTASSLWTSRAVSTDPNSPNLSNGSYYQPHRIIAAASYRIEYAKHFATSIGAIFEAAPNGVTSYVYNGDLNNDGSASNDLIYIPRSSSEIALINSGSYNRTTGAGSTTGTAADPRTATQIWAQLNNFINQDRYLATRRGQYAKANAVVLPYYKRLDLNITQDIYFNTGKDRHTLRLSMDLVNAGNFVNRNWGTYRTTNLNNFLRFEGMAADGKTPLMSFSYLNSGSQIPLTNSFREDAGILSRWQMQFGIRYLFN